VVTDIEDYSKAPGLKGLIMLGMETLSKVVPPPYIFQTQGSKLYLVRPGSNSIERDTSLTYLVTKDLRASHSKTKFRV
jgi:hypothetical protein